MKKVRDEDSRGKGLSETLYY